MSNPTVSVVIPFYRGSRQLRRALRSVHLQTYTDYEVIVVSDDSPDELRWVASEFPETIVVVQSPNRGPGAARNTGVDASSGSYVAFLDSDDWWYPNKLLTQIPLMQAAGAFWGHHPYDVVTDNGSTIRRVDNINLFGDVRRQTLRSFRVQTSCMVFRREIFTEGLYGFGEMRVGEDGHLYQQVAREHELHRTPHTLSAFVSHGDNSGFSPAVQLWSRSQLSRTLETVPSSELDVLDRVAYRWTRLAATTLGIEGDTPPAPGRHALLTAIAYAPAWLVFRRPGGRNQNSD